MSRKYYLVAMLLTAGILAATAVVYPHLPSSVATHWNLHNQPNGYSQKWTLFLIGPGMMVAMMLLMYALSWLSPKNFEVDSFRSTYLQIMLMLVGMMAYFQVVILWANTGHPLNVGRAIVGGICLIFTLLGNLMGKVRRNFYVGIRTPWALSNERVWNATHRFAGKTIVACGLAGCFLPSQASIRGRYLCSCSLAAWFPPCIRSFSINNWSAAVTSDATQRDFQEVVAREKQNRKKSVAFDNHSLSPSSRASPKQNDL